MQLEDWKYGRTLSGTPQGGVVSPILANIYLDRLDKYVETVLIPAHTRGKARKRNRAWVALSERTARQRKLGNHRMAAQLRRRGSSNAIWMRSGWLRGSIYWVLLVLMSRLREGRANTARGAAHFLRETVGRVRHAGARGQLTVRADSGFYAHALVVVCREMDVRFSITIRQHARLRELIEAIPEEDWTPVPYWMDGGADVAETTYTPFTGEPEAAPVRLIVRRVKPTPGSQLALFASYSYHGFITDRDGETLELEADHRRHAEIENAIRDLKHGVGLNHLPSGRFPANGAWLAVQVLAHNLARWTARIGLDEGVVTTRTLRRRFFSLAGRLTRSARRLTLHLPDRWPWAEKFSRALARLRAIPLPA